MLLSVFAVASGGALGALCRYATVALVQVAPSRSFPLGTLFVNCLGSFLMGLIMSFIFERLAFNGEFWRLLLVVGFIGSYTTFSSFSWETCQLYINGQWVAAATNVLLNNVGTLLMVFLGIHTGRVMGSA